MKLIGLTDCSCDIQTSATFPVTWERHLSKQWWQSQVPLEPFYSVSLQIYHLWLILCIWKVMGIFYNITLSVSRDAIFTFASCLWIFLNKEENDNLTLSRIITCVQRQHDCSLSQVAGHQSCVDLWVVQTQREGWWWADAGCLRF